MKFFALFVISFALVALGVCAPINDVVKGLTDLAKLPGVDKIDGLKNALDGAKGVPKLEETLKGADLSSAEGKTAALGKLGDLAKTTQGKDLEQLKVVIDTIKKS